MKPEIKKIIDQHRKPKSKRQLLAEGRAREWEDNWRREYEAKLQAEEDAIPYEAKKNFINTFKKGGITVGDAARANGIDDISLAARILSKQIKPGYHFIEELE